MDETTAIDLAAIKIYYDNKNDFDSSLEYLPQEALEQYIPRRMWLKRKPEEWMKVLQHQGPKVLGRMSKSEAQQYLVKIAMELETFGSTIFPVQQKVPNPKLPNSFEIAVSASHVKFIKPDTKEVIKYGIYRHVLMLL